MAELGWNSGEALAHIRRDPVMSGLIDRVGPVEYALRGEPFAALLRTILYQQLAGHAASAIERRFMALFGDRYPTPPELRDADVQAIRAAGVSQRKAEYLLDAARHAVDGTVPFDRLDEMDDAEVEVRLTAIRGVGPWTAQVLLMFSLGRPDVLPVGDYALRRGVQLAYALDDLPAAARLTAIAEPWRPFRSLGSLYIWQSLSSVVPEGEERRPAAGAETPPDGEA